jgi:hypothetical protein
MANNQLLASDNFASGSLAGGWSVIPTNSFSQVTGTPFVAEPPSLVAGGRQYWSGLAWPNDHVSEMTVAAQTAETGTQVELWSRVQSGSYSGYLAAFGGLVFTATIFRCDAGVFTSLATTTAISAPAAGDVLTFAAIGSALVVYQNYKQVLRWMDATYVSGSPGMGGSSTINVTHSQVGSWRGYNDIQQDGIWQKQGVILAPLAGDFTTGSGGIANATMLVEGNAQILSGTVFKLWFSAGGPGAETNSYYAESTDGKIWSRFGSAVIAGQGSPFVIKSGATYYLYTQPNGSNGVGNFSVYTSANGTSWTVQATNILGVLGGAGVWDGVMQWYFQPVAIIGGTWYGIYSGSNSSVTAQLKLGLATSPDGITWTKSGSNPVLTAANGGAVVNSAALVKIGSTYYMWMFGSIPGRGGTPTLLNPGEGVLYRTTDFITWTFVHHSVHQSQLQEGVNSAQGQSYPNGIFTVGSQSYMYIQAAVVDAGTPSIYQLALAIANVPVSQIVNMSEDGTLAVSSDNFTRANGPLGAAWTTPLGGSPAQIVSNFAEATVPGTAAYAVYTATAFAPDQYSEITVQTLATNNNINPGVRRSTSALTGYIGNIAGPLGSASTAAIFKEITGVFTQIGPTVTVTPQVGDVFRLSVVGNVLSLFQNSFMVLQVEDVNNSITSGSPSFRISPDNISLANAQLSAWGGGTAGIVPPAGGGGSGDLGPGYDFKFRL